MAAPMIFPKCNSEHVVLLLKYLSGFLLILGYRPKSCMQRFEPSMSPLPPMTLPLLTSSAFTLTVSHCTLSMLAFFCLRFSYAVRPAWDLLGPFLPPTSYCYLVISGHRLYLKSDRISSGKSFLRFCPHPCKARPYARHVCRCSLCLQRTEECAMLLADYLIVSPTREKFCSYCHPCMPSSSLMLGTEGPDLRVAVTFAAGLISRLYQSISLKGVISSLGGVTLRYRPYS